MLYARQMSDIKFHVNGHNKKSFVWLWLFWFAKFLAVESKTKVFLPYVDHFCGSWKMLAWVLHNSVTMNTCKANYIAKRSIVIMTFMGTFAFLWISLTSNKSCINIISSWTHRSFTLSRNICSVSKTEITLDQEHTQKCNHRHRIELWNGK